MRSLRILQCLRLAALLAAVVVAGHASAQDATYVEIQQLNKRAVASYLSGDARAALPLAERAVALGEQLFPEQGAGLATLLDNLASIRAALSDFTGAEALQARVVAIRERTLGPSHPDTATAVNNLGAYYYGMAAYDKALPLQERALALREQLLGAEHVDTAISLNNVALAQTALGAYAKAESLYERALPILEKALGPEHSTTATALNNLGELYRKSGAYAKAEPLLQRALAIRERALGPAHPDTAGALNNLALIYESMGRYAPAEELYQRSLSINEQALGAEHPATVNSVANLAQLYQRTGAYAKAEPLQQRTLQIRERILGSQHPDTAISLNNLALLYMQTGAYAQAETLYQQAVAANEVVFGATHPTVATSLSNLAVLYAMRGDYRRAEELQQRVLAIRERTLGSEHPDTALSLNNLAQLYQNRRGAKETEALFRRALAINEAAVGPDHPDGAAILHNLGNLYSTRREYAAAEAIYERVQTIDERNAALFLLSGSEARQQQFLQQRVLRVSADVALSQTHRTPRSTRLGLTSVLQYKGRVLDATSNSIARLRRSVAAEDRALLEQLAATAQELSNLTFRGTGSGADHRSRLSELTQQRDTLQAQLAARSAAFGDTVPSISMEAVRQALPDDAALVEWIRYRPVALRGRASQWGPAHYLAYVLKRNGEPVAIDVGDAQAIETLITRFRAALLEPADNGRGASRVRNTRSDVRELARQLGKRLIAPLRQHLDRGRLLLSPDGALNLVPFAALTDEHGEYLVERFEISYLTSGRDLLRMGAVEPARDGVVILADPDYGMRGRRIESATAQRSADLDRSGLAFDALPGTALEAQALQSLLTLDAARVLTAGRASEAQLRALRGPRILHLATHGFFLEDEDLSALFNTSANELAELPLTENPLLRSGLALAGANAREDGSDDGILTAAEVAQLDLRGTQLVVLSACETALGTVDAGEGVYGLRRALVLAGAQSQLVSMWKVDDVATQSLMVQYYQQLLQGAGRAAALRNVQRALLADPDRQHPYYWAAFIPIGNWQPLVTTQ